MNEDTATVVVAAFSLLVSMVAVFVTVRVSEVNLFRQREEAIRQRQILSASNVMSAAYNMVRFSHRDRDKYLDYSSTFEIAARTLALDAVNSNLLFVEELMEWMQRLRHDVEEVATGVTECVPDDVLELGIQAARSNTHDFVAYLSDWIAADLEERPRIEADMTSARLRLWPEITEIKRSWPRPGRRASRPRLEQTSSEQLLESLRRWAKRNSTPGGL